MSMLIALAVLAGLGAVLYGVVVTIRADGLGHRPGPRSAPSDLPRWRQLVL